MCFYGFELTLTLIKKLVSSSECITYTKSFNYFNLIRFMKFPAFYEYCCCDFKMGFCSRYRKETEDASQECL